MARLIHGAVLKDITFKPENIISGLISAFFHDTGLIQTTDDKEGSGAKYTVGHEMRSIDVVNEVLDRHNFSKQQLKDCGPLIKSTILQMPFEKINFRNKEIARMGQFLGTADLLGQIADRKYLEKLILLFDEFEEAGIDNFESEIELLHQTENFNKNIANKKMKQDFGNVARYMRPHFKKRWNIDKDLYAESVEKNITYLKTIVEECKSDRDCFYNKLKRGSYW
ncbi:MAG: hypothetical protein K9L30_06095 [Desulfobacterales bacterium]|nr:hypothetical protein [Desulfobacterales bacterium]